MSYAMSITLDRPFDDVVADVRSVLADQGFGILTEINMQETLLNKIGVEIDKQIILGACSPAHAHRALLADPSIGLLLPCNVVVRGVETGTVVEMINPQMIADMSDSPDIHTVANEVTEKLTAAMESLKKTGSGLS